MENFLSHFEIEKQDLKLIQERLQIINIEKDFKVNDKCLGFIKILKGELRAFILTPNAKEITLFHLKENVNSLFALSVIWVVYLMMFLYKVLKIQV